VWQLGACPPGVGEATADAERSGDGIVPGLGRAVRYTFLANVGRPACAERLGKALAGAIFWWTRRRHESA
jgi:hypothetical protein